MGCSALLSVVSQLLSVCNPADSLVRLQRGAAPVAACLQAPAELCKAVAAASQAFGNRLSVFPDRQNIIVLVGGVALPLPHAASGADRLARCPPCKACQKSAMLPLAKKIPYVTRPASRSHPGMFAVSVARRHRTPFSFFSVNVITPSPSCRLWSRSAAGLPTASSRYLGLNRKARHPSALTQASGRVPAFRRVESGGTKLRDSAL